MIVAFMLELSEFEVLCRNKGTSVQITTIQIRISPTSSCKCIYHNGQDAKNDLHNDEHDDDGLQMLAMTTVDAFFQQREHVLQDLMMGNTSAVSLIRIRKIPTSTRAFSKSIR